MDKAEKEIVLKPSRIYFLANYIIAGLVAIFLVLLYTTFNLSLTLFPKTGEEMFHTLLFLGILGVGASMIEQPEWERFRNKIIVGMNDVVKESGIFKKHRISLPYSTVSDVRGEKTVFGRVFNYGTLKISSFKEGSDMEMNGIRNINRIHEIIQERINQIREGQLGYWEKQGGKEDDEEKPVKRKKGLDKKEMKERKRELQEMIEEMKKRFYNREIDQEQFERSVEKYEQKIIEIDVKLRKGGKKAKDKEINEDVE